jgi:hypothetical protein
VGERPPPTFPPQGHRRLIGQTPRHGLLAGEMGPSTRLVARQQRYSRAAGLPASTCPHRPEERGIARVPEATVPVSEPGATPVTAAPNPVRSQAELADTQGLDYSMVTNAPGPQAHWRHSHDANPPTTAPGAIRPGFLIT